MSSPDPYRLLFNPQQEMYLGEIVSEHLQSRFLVVGEDEVNAYLRRVGNRVASQLPKSDMQYQFFPLRSAGDSDFWSTRGKNLCFPKAARNTTFPDSSRSPGSITVTTGFRISPLTHTWPSRICTMTSSGVSESRNTRAVTIRSSPMATSVASGGNDSIRRCDQTDSSRFLQPLRRGAHLPKTIS
jgi:hypothetical protein